MKTPPRNIRINQQERCWQRSRTNGYARSLLSSELIWITSVLPFKWCRRKCNSTGVPTPAGPSAVRHRRHGNQRCWTRSPSDQSRSPFEIERKTIVSSHLLMPRLYFQVDIENKKFFFLSSLISWEAMSITQGEEKKKSSMRVLFFPPSQQ